MKRKKRPMTLLETMVVIFIIGIVGSVIGYNMRGSLSKGKEFKTARSAEKLREILILECDLRNIDPAAKTWSSTVVRNVLRDSGLVKDIDALMKDGWGEKFKVEYSTDRQEFDVSSSHYNKKEEAE